MSGHHLIQFSQPVRAVSIAGQAAPVHFSHADLEAAEREGYRRGSEEASRMLERQMIEQRDELIHLQSRTFVALDEQRATLVGQVRDFLPQLVMEGIARILGGFQSDRENVIRIVDDLLAELSPTGETLEVQLHAADLAMITGYDETLREKFPAIAFRAVTALRPGDAIVRSRFGTIDGRLGTKFKMVEAMFE